MTGLPTSSGATRRTRDLYVWFMKGTKAVSASYLPRPDFSDRRGRSHASRTSIDDGEGRHPVAKQPDRGPLVWYMNGTTVASRSSLVPSQLSDSTWRVEPR